MKLYHILLALSAFFVIQIRAMEVPELAKSSSNQLGKMKISAIVHSDLLKQDLLEQERARLKRYSDARNHMTKIEQDFKKRQKKEKITEVINELNVELKEKSKEWQLPIKKMNISSLKFDLNDLENAMKPLIQKINEKEHMNQKYELLRDRSWIRWEAECLATHYKNELEERPEFETQLIDKYTKLLKKSQAKWQYPIEPIANINELPTIIKNLDTTVQNLEDQIATYNK